MTWSVVFLACVWPAWSLRVLSPSSDGEWVGANASFDVRLGDDSAADTGAWQLCFEMRSGGAPWSMRQCHLAPREWPATFALAPVGARRVELRWTLVSADALGAAEAASRAGERVVVQAAALATLHVEGIAPFAEALPSATFERQAAASARVWAAAADGLASNGLDGVEVLELALSPDRAGWDAVRAVLGGARSATTIELRSSAAPAPSLGALPCAAVAARARIGAERWACFAVALDGGGGGACAGSRATSDTAKLGSAHETFDAAIERLAPGGFEVVALLDGDGVGAASLTRAQREQLVAFARHKARRSVLVHDAFVDASALDMASARRLAAAGAWLLAPRSGYAFVAPPPPPPPIPPSPGARRAADAAAQRAARGPRALLDVAAAPRGADDRAARSSIGFSLAYGQNAAVVFDACVRFEPPAHDGAYFGDTAGSMARDRRNDVIVVELYRGDDAYAPPLVPRDVGEKLALGQYGFKYGWRFEEHAGRPPPPTAAPATGDDGPALIARPAYGLHITHFAEAVMLLFHAAFACQGGEAAADQGGSGAPCGFAAFARPGSPLLLPTVRTGDLTRLRPWLGSFLACLLHARQSLAAADERDAGDALASARRAPRVLVRDDLDAIEGLRPLCFRELGLVGTTASEFGLFASDDEARSFRAASVEWAEQTAAARAAAVVAPFAPPPPPPPGPNDRLRVLLVTRGGTRRLRNARALADGLEATGLVSWIEARPPAADADEPRAVRLERLAFEEQVLLAHAADVLVCVHGAALTSALFMREGAVAIDVLPSNFVEYAWHHLAVAAGVHYLFVPHASHDADDHARRCAPHAPACATGAPYAAGRMECLGVRNCDVAADVGAVELVLRQADVLVRQRMRGLDRAHAPAVAPWLRGRLADGRMEPLLDPP